ncbi:isochorismate hydrolase [Chthonomonas calidirosea]|uniref:isochorismatase family protein n=1 Tax=Chthonomonas calidirosea TaxID=454171 RepID=UPI0006DD4A98|nr:isochorismatase family protein [Chthonomonas calidirosea]CEK16075.1 isochorismate hydrolase [Chthonomonas calidirosea]
MTVKHPALLCSTESVLVAIDLQETLLRTLPNTESLLRSTRLLLQGAQALGIPLLVTTQNRDKLGGVTKELADLLPKEDTWLDKLCFNCAGASNFVSRLQALQKRQVVLCGVETHICVCQTALGLLAEGYQVHIVSDAVAARSQWDHELGLRKMFQVGALPSSVEMVLYEWLEEAGSTSFRAILPLIKANQNERKESGSHAR